jgi:hypothetical protein
MRICRSPRCGGAGFGLSRDDVCVEDMVRWLADEFAVTTSAMRVRLQQMKVVRA